jgi:hypothetical protein
VYLTEGNAVGFKARPVVSPWKISFSLDTWNTLKDIFGIIILFVLSILFVYFLPQAFSKVFFLGLIVAFWFSKRDYFWFAFFFILAQGPAWFFSDFSATAQFRLPLFSFLPHLSFSPLDFFVIVALLKAIKKGTKVKLGLERPLLIILIYMSFSFLFSAILGARLATLFTLLRGAFYYSIIISFAYLVRTRKEAYRFILSATPMLFFVLCTQIYYLLKGVFLVSLFDPGFLPQPGFTGQALIEGTDQRRAIGAGFLLVFFSYIFSLFLIEHKKSGVSRKYIYLIVGASWLSLIVSATRVWFGVFLLILAGYVLTTKEKTSKLAKISLALFLLFFVLIMTNVVSLDFLFEGALPRLGQIASVAAGHFHSVGTFETRYFVRLPRVLEGLKKHIFLGCGFSDAYLEYRDYHVGFFNTILQFGLVGFSLFLYFFIRYFGLLKATIRKLSVQNSLRGPLKTLPVFFVGILVANFTTWYFFPISTLTDIPFFVSIYIGLTELFVREAGKEELTLQRVGSRV